MIGIGIIGCGKIAQIRHIPECLENQNAKLVGFFDLDQERAEGLAKLYGGRAFASYQELLAEDSIQAVSVCAANAAHAQITIDALEAGKDVLCEKPMATTLEDCKRMVEAAHRCAKKLMIDQNQRLAKAHVEAKKLIDAGEIGRIVTFHTAFGHGGPETWGITPGKNTWFFDKKSASMGAIADLGIHKTDLIQFLTSERVVETTAKLMTLEKRDSFDQLIDVDDNAICIYKLSSGAVGTMTASWTYYGAEDNSTVLYGTKGIMKIYDDPNHSIVVIKPDGTHMEYDVEAIQTNENQTKSGIVDAFLECLVENKEPEISGDSVLNAMKAVFASIRSSEMNCTIAVN